MEKNSNVVVAIILASLILGGFYFATQVSKQQSIERQQQLELQEKQRAAEMRLDQENKQFIADRRADCLAIYKTESEKWGNVRGWRYSNGECAIRYRSSDPGFASRCDKTFPISDTSSLFALEAHLLCQGGEFEQIF